METLDREELARTMAALGHPTRLAIVAMLTEGPCIVSDLIERLGEAQSTISKHLATLKSAGLLACAPDGRCRMYALVNPDAVRTALVALRSVGQPPADAASSAKSGGDPVAQR